MSRTAAKGIYREWLTDDGLLLIEKWKRAGLTDKQIAEDKIGISEDTLSTWKRKYEPINNALKRSREKVVGDLENALIKRALGFTGPDGKYYPPDKTALIFALKNMDPATWRDKVEVQTEDGGMVIRVEVPEEYKR